MNETITHLPCLFINWLKCAAILNIQKITNRTNKTRIQKKSGFNEVKQTLLCQVCIPRSHTPFCVCGRNKGIPWRQ